MMDALSAKMSASFIVKKTMKKGDKYGRLTAVRFSHRDNCSNQYWLFKCDCDSEKVIGVNNVKNGNTQSCGCLRKEMMRERQITHEMTKTPEYESWARMKQRCLNKNNDKFKYYGGRGIKICDRWLKFENFYSDMGERLKKMTLDRIDNGKGYYKENCRWVTIKEQANNRRNNHLITFNGKTQTLAQWEKEVGIGQHTLYYRLVVSKWNIRKAFTYPVKH